MEGVRRFQQIRCQHGRAAQCRQIGDGSSSGEGSIGGGAHYADKLESTGTSINSGGSVTIKGGNVVNQEARIQSQDGTRVSGNPIQQKAANHDISVGIELSVSGKGEAPAR